MENKAVMRGNFSGKVILISIDGMRPDGVQQCGFESLKELEAKCSYAYEARTVFPSITLPCHYSMMHSVPPERHGILSNTYVEPVRFVDGIFERIKAAGGLSALFYGWEPMRHVYNSGSTVFSQYVNAYADEYGDAILTDCAEHTIERYEPDFVYLYMVETDEKGGHDCGWMSDGYLTRVRLALENAKRMIDKFGDKYSVIITADHGGHDRMHGTDLPEDMTIPMFFYGKGFTPGKRMEGIGILDIAPTIAKIMGVIPAPEWEGKPVL